MKLFPIIQHAYHRAVGKPTSGLTRQTLHAERSRFWVESLAAEFRAAYADEPNVLAFSKYHDAHRAEFGLNELLYDICVCRTATVPSARRKLPLHYVQQALWQVESEFARNTKHALFDFNKLVLGSSERKLFVGPIVSDCAGFLNVLALRAESCSGEVFVALLPEPAQWPSELQPRVYRFVKSWEELTY